jgi:dihydrofolate synthase/folylpolyglutamate synthase
MSPPGRAAMSQTPLVTDYPSALEYLLGRVNYERTTAIPYGADTFKLDRMRQLMSLLGDPHLALKAVHIAGTKGKGSTAAMIAAILSAASLKTALYTSPHLDAIEERIALGGRPCHQDDFVRLAAEVQDAEVRLTNLDSAGEVAPTFFEVTTAMAFLHFARQRVDVAVLEVGLGGRLDSTNVCRPSVTVITSISFDHMKQLGSTLAAIAGEKAGIIKPGVPVISGVTQDEPRAVIRKIARERQARLYECGAEYDFAHIAPPRTNDESALQIERMHYREPDESPGYSLEDVALGMLGRHQSANAAAAIAAVRRLVEQGWDVDETAIRAGLAQARCPARIEVVARDPLVILDVAHNTASVAALVAVLCERFPTERRVLVFASSRDKETAAMLDLLVPHFESIVLTRYIHNPRAVELPQLQTLTEAACSAAPSNGQPAHSPTIQLAETPAEAWSRARQLAGARGLVCITGSFFLAAELRPMVTEATLEPIATITQ